MTTTTPGHRLRRAVAGLGSATALALVSAVVVAAPAGAATSPDLTKATAYLTSHATLVGGTHYELFAGFADYGLTMDGAFALAASHTDDPSLAAITDHVAFHGDTYTGVGTDFAVGGAIGKEALLAEVTGNDPQAFGGHDLLASLHTATCTSVSTAPDTSCPAVGAYTSTGSVFSQATGVLAQLRAQRTSDVAAPEAYLESLQHTSGASSGAWPSLIPSTDATVDVDSTAMAAMALAADPGGPAQAAVTKALTWLTTRQESDGGFPGAAGDSTNSAALAVQALSLKAATYASQIAKGKAFLASVQNKDGGFRVASDHSAPKGSDVRASAQALGGAVGTPFTTLTRDISAATPPTVKVLLRTTTGSTSSSVTTTGQVKVSWKGYTNAAPVASYDLYVRRGAFDHDVARSWTKVGSALTVHSANVDVAPGETLVAAVRGQDVNGVRSLLSAMSAHVTAPIAATDLRRTAHLWTPVTGAYFSRTAGAHATTPTVSRVRDIYVVAATGVGYGRPTLYVGPTKVATFDLSVSSPSKALRDKVFVVHLTPSQTRHLSGVISLHVVTSGRTVRLVGLGMRR